MGGVLGQLTFKCSWQVTTQVASEHTGQKRYYFRGPGGLDRRGSAVYLAISTLVTIQFKWREEFVRNFDRCVNIVDKLPPVCWSSTRLVDLLRHQLDAMCFYSSSSSCVVSHHRFTWKKQVLMNDLQPRIQGGAAAAHNLSQCLILWYVHARVGGGGGEEGRCMLCHQFVDE